MNIFSIKKDLETSFTQQDLTLLYDYYHIAPHVDKRDKLWLLSLAISHAHIISHMNGTEIPFNDYFEYIGVLGEGKFGAVIHAKTIKQFEKLLPRVNVAIKLIPYDIKNKDVIEKEVNILKRIYETNKACHPHVVCYYGSTFMNYEGNSYYAIIMEYIAGTELLKEIRTFKYSDTQILQTMKSLASALKFLHDNNIVHRDIKSNNILMDASHIPKFVDFGFSCFTVTDMVNSCKNERPVKGSPSNMAPELWVEYLNSPLSNLSPPASMNYVKKFAEYTDAELYQIYKATDVWALGMVFYELLFKKQPSIYDGAYFNMSDLAFELVDDWFTIPKTKDPQLTNIVSLMLTKDYRVRPTISDIVTQLDAIRLP